MLPEKVSVVTIRLSECVIVMEMVLGKKNKVLRDR